jgi:hypothetical protein
MIKSWNCKSKCRSKWHSNSELRRRYNKEGIDKMTGKTRAYYDVAITPRQAYKIMRKVMDELEETGDWKVK